VTSFRRLALTSSLAALLLVSLGGLVRATGSGLGCPGWPLCYGRVLPPIEYHALIEYSHRLVASAVVILIVALAIVAIASRVYVRFALAAVGVVFLQAALGAVVVNNELSPLLVAVHFGTAMLLVAILTGLAAAASSAGRDRVPDGRVARMATAAVGATALLLLVGAYLRGSGAPRTGSALVRPGLLMLHAVLAVAVFGHVAATVAAGLRDPRASVRKASLGPLIAFPVQIGFGLANVAGGLAQPAVVGHVAMASVAWASVVALAVVSRYDDQHEHAPGRLGAYVQLTKPRIVLLLLVTTVPAMVLAQRGMPSGWLVLATLVGGTLASGGANAINQYLDRDIDEKMTRTRRRPLPSARIAPPNALWFGIALGVAGFVWLAATVNLLSAVLAVGALLFYVFVYTVWLKRTSTQNIVIGGAAGAVPCLVGWAAVRGTLGAPAWIMFAIVFLWTPPHFWALAMRYRDDYAAADIPMLPVVRTASETSRQIVWYSVVLVAVTVVLYPVAGLGALYLGAAVGLGGIFLYRAVRLWRAPTSEQALGLFKYSISYLALLFAAMGVDRLVLR
jgi:protoheme IX farnesyltransferase